MELRDLRIASGLTQRNVGDKVGVTAQAISSYECGKRKPSAPVAEEIAKIFNLTTDQMWQMLYKNQDQSA